MFSLFRMERYRFVRTKTVYIVTCIVLAITCIGTVLMGMEDDTTMLGEADDGLVVVVSGGVENVLNICKIHTGNINSVMNLLFLGIVISIFVHAEFKDGYIKSIAGQIPNKGMLCLSKLYIIALYLIVMFVLEFLVTLATAYIKFPKERIEIGFDIKYIALWATIFLLYMAVASIFILVSSYSRSSAWGIGVTMVVGLGMTYLLYKAINWGLSKIGISSFDISKYMPDFNMQLMTLDTDGKTIIRGAMVGILFTIIAIYASIVLQNKRDI